MIYATPSKDDYRSLYGIIDKFLVRESVWKTFLIHNSLLFVEFSAKLFVYGRVDSAGQLGEGASVPPPLLLPE